MPLKGMMGEADSSSEPPDSPRKAHSPTSHHSAQERAAQNRTFRIFLVLYSLFLMPLLWALVKDYMEDLTFAPDIIPMSPSAYGLFGWTLTVRGRAARG